MSEPAEQDDSCFLPNLCRAEALFMVILGAELLAIVLSLALPLNTRDILLDLALNSLFIQWIALGSAGALCLARPYLAGLSDRRAGVVSLAVILAVALIVGELGWHFLYAAPERPDLWHWQGPHGLFLLRSVGITAIVAAIVLRYLYIQHQWRDNVETIARLRYQALQARIRPHFLFNCLNTIAGLTRKAPAQAEQSIEDLADLFRASLLEPTDMIRLAEEWAICQTYLRIEQQRLGARLRVRWAIAGLPEDALIPPLTLQPLLENMIYHGIERIPGGGEISIKGALRDRLIQIEFANPLPASDLEATRRGNRLAQQNIRERLAAGFGRQGRLAVEQDQGVYRVRLSFPRRTIP